MLSIPHKLYRQLSMAWVRSKIGSPCPSEDHARSTSDLASGARAGPWTSRRKARGKHGQFVNEEVFRFRPMPEGLKLKHTPTKKSSKTLTVPLSLLGLRPSTLNPGGQGAILGDQGEEAGLSRGGRPRQADQTSAFDSYSNDSKPTLTLLFRFRLWASEVPGCLAPDRLTKAR